MKQFIKNKWYKGEDTGNYYMKFSHIVAKETYNQLYYTERIHWKTYDKCNENWANTDFELFALANGPVPISEIAKYLPLNHPDLITQANYWW